MTNLVNNRIRDKSKIGFKKTIIKKTVDTLVQESNVRLNKYLSRSI